MQRLPDFILHAVRAPSASADATSTADAPAAEVRLYEALEEWPDPLAPGAGVMVRYLDADARTTYFGHSDDDADTRA